MEFMVKTPGKWSSSIYGQLGCIRVEQDLKAEGSSVSVWMSGNANNRARNEEMYGVVLNKHLNLSQDGDLKKINKNKNTKLMLNLEWLSWSEQYLLYLDF